MISGSKKLLIAVYASIGLCLIALRFLLLPLNTIYAIESGCAGFMLLAWIFFMFSEEIEGKTEYGRINFIGIGFLMCPFATTVVIVTIVIYMYIMFIARKLRVWADKHLKI